MLMSILSETLCTLRKRARLNQAQLAASSGCVRKTIGSWEKGKTAPDDEDLRKLARALRADYDELKRLRAEPDAKPSKTVTMDEALDLIRSIAHLVATGPQRDTPSMSLLSLTRTLGDVLAAMPPDMRAATLAKGAVAEKEVYERLRGRTEKQQA